MIIWFTQANLAADVSVLLRNFNFRKPLAIALSSLIHLFFLGVILRPRIITIVSPRKILGVVELRSFQESKPEQSKAPSTRKRRAQIENALRPLAVEQTKDVSPESVDHRSGFVAANTADTADATERSGQSYATEVRRKIGLHKKYPLLAQSRSQQGRVEIRLSIARDGECRAIEIAKSSGFRILDEAVSRAVKDVGRFDAFPAELKLTSIELVVPIDFVL